MNSEQIYTLSEIKSRIERYDFPFSGITELGSAYFEFRKPSFYAGVALHAGHRVRDEILDAMEVKLEDRYREEDPHTERFIMDSPIQIIARDSRFEYDLNRERARAVYEEPVWGLNVLKRPLTPEEKEGSLSKYDEFHNLMDIATAYLFQQNQYGVIFDCHSYNYQREEKLPWHQDKKPVINVGTGPVNRLIFGHIIDDFLNRLGEISIDGHFIYAGENIVFKGGYLSRRLSKEHNNKLLVLAIEFKKIFMDEWSGQVYEDILEDLAEQFSQVCREVEINKQTEGR